MARDYFEERLLYVAIGTCISGSERPGPSRGGVDERGKYVEWVGVFTSRSSESSYGELPYTKDQLWCALVSIGGGDGFKVFMIDAVRASSLV